MSPQESTSATGFRVGRLGWKAQHASVLAFAADASNNEMGITNRFFPIENAPNGKRELLAHFNIGTEVEDVIDPATGLADVDKADQLYALPRTVVASRHERQC